jgi:hypothetical protein
VPFISVVVTGSKSTPTFPLQLILFSQMIYLPQREKKDLEREKKVAIMAVLADRGDRGGGIEPISTTAKSYVSFPYFCSLRGKFGNSITVNRPLKRQKFDKKILVS